MVNLASSFFRRWLVRDPKTRCALFDCFQPRAAFEKVVTTIGELITRLTDLRCNSGHVFVEILWRIAGTLFNVFTSN